MNKTKIVRGRIRRNGQIVHAHRSSTPVPSATRDGAVLHKTSILDLIERKTAEEKAAWLAAYPRDNPNPILELDLEGNAIYYANPSTFKSFPDLQRLGLRHPFLVRVLEAAKPLLEGETKPVHAEIDVRKSCYAVTIVRISETRRLRLYSVDVTERRQAEIALQRSKKLLEKLVHQRTKALRTANKELENEINRRKGLEDEILEISDREQQRLGQELHDGICQHLAAVAFMARSVALRLKNHRVIEVNDIEKIAQLVNDAATDTRNLSRALHRADIDAATLPAALQDLVDREIWRIPCGLKIKPSFHMENDTAAAQLYRIAREAVINANKHAQARQITVELDRSGKEIVLRVIDDGVGFQNEPKLKEGLGFHIMNYRARSIGGRLKIDSPKRRGTRVACYLPDSASLSPHTRTKEPRRSGLLVI